MCLRRVIMLEKCFLESKIEIIVFYIIMILLGILYMEYESKRLEKLYKLNTGLNYIKLSNITAL